MNIFVANLDYSIENEQLQAIFEQYGNVDLARVITDKETGRSKGFGFVEMPDDESAQNAIEDMNGMDMKGRELVVKEARPREERPNNNYGGGNRGGYRNNNGGY